MKRNPFLFFLPLILAMQLSFGQQNSVEKSIDYLEQNKCSPEDFIIKAFTNREVILLAEDHRVKENLEFLQSLIPKLYQAGVYNIGMEFGAFEDQSKLDSLVNAPKYSEDIARQLMFNYNTGWAFKEYMDVYKAAWEFNKSLSSEKPKFRIVNLSYKFHWSSFNGVRTPENMKIVFHQGNPESFRFHIVEKEILNKKQKIIIITGAIHASTKYKFPVYDYLAKDYVRYENTWFGNQLYNKLGDKVYSIILHHPFSNYPNKKPFLVSPANGNIEKIMAKLNKPKVGFDLASTPMGQLNDNSYYSLGNNNLKLSDIYDGYIFLKPLNNLNGCTIDTLFINDKNWSSAMENMPDPDWRQRPKNLKEYWKQIYEFADVPKIYSQVDK